MRMAATAAVYNRLHNSSMGGGGLGHHSQLARSLERILEEAHLSGELILTNRKLKDFPKTGTKYNLADTVIADLSRNRFCELPEEITSFSFLETLLLYHNTIRSIPESVKHLTSLTYLDLRSNQLSSLPREICFLPLQVLLVSNNRLTTLPDELGRMERLTDLDASYNQLTALPARVGELRSLRSFSLRSNQLMYLPRELTCLTLVSLDVSNNRIASLPLEIRQMSTLVEFNLENNPLTSPPASLCIRGLVHVFKFLETQAIKDEKGSRAGGNYDGYTTLRRAPRHNSSGNMLETNRVPRHHVDSGYSTCDGIDKRWSHDMPNAKANKNDSPVRKMPITTPSSLSAELMDASLTSSTSTIVDESIASLNAAVVKPLNTDLPNNMSPLKQKDDHTIVPQQQQHQQQPTLHQHINYAHSSSSNGSSPDQDDLMIDHHQQQQNNQNGKNDEKSNKNLGNVQTYREYKEALKQQRNLEISSVYKMKGQKTLYDMSEASNALNSNIITHTNDENELRYNGNNIIGSRSNTTSPQPKSIMKNGGGGGGVSPSTMNGIGGDDCVVIPKKPIQKVIPSRNTELMSTQAATKMQSTNDMDSNNRAATIATQYTNGDCLGYVKPNSPMKTAANGAIASGAGSGVLSSANNNKFTPISGIKSPVSSTTKLGTAKTHRSVTWNHDIPAEKLSFTMRREFDRQREEIELMTQLRSIIETRLKMTLPEDIASALTDGVILCHLANYVRPRSVASIHVPSPGVSKLTMARCRRNVDNFLEACRRIGVDEELICSCQDVVPSTPIDDDDDDHDDNNDDGYVNGVSNNIGSSNNNNNYSMHDDVATMGKQKMRPRHKLPNPTAVLKTVSALIAMDFNPHHQNIRNLQQQHELQVKLKKQQQRQQCEQQQQHQQQHIDYQRCTSQAQDYDEEHIDDDRDNNDDVDDNNDRAHEQQQQQQLQLTATCTKEQMHHPSEQQPQQQTHEFVATLNFNAKYHFANVLANGNGHNDDDTVNENGDTYDNDDDDDNDDNANGDIDDYNDVDNNVVVVDDCVANNDNNIMLHCGRKQKRTGKVSQFLRHAKLRTFQKIKLNLITSHGNNCNGSGSGNNHCTSLATTLQTIVETEGDVIATGGSDCNVAVRSVPGGGGNGGVYQLINEKPNNEEIQLKVNASVTPTFEKVGNKYKLLPSLQQEHQQDDIVGAALVSKRIEFFEHSSSSSPSMPLHSATMGATTIITTTTTTTTTITSTTTTAPTSINNGGLSLGVTNKFKNNIFSIYRTNAATASADTVDGKGLLSLKDTSNEAGSSLLSHDSHILTIILSCVFIVTFLLVVIFPLPG